MQIHTIHTPSLGDRSYVVTDGEAAAVVDPQRDIDRILDVVGRHGLRVTDVFETHLHNDYVTGGYQLARTTGATYHVAAGDDVSFDRTPIGDGDTIAVGSFTVRAVHTPGHTATHLSYVVSDDERDVAVFTGGSMLFGSVGRTDLISKELTEELTRAQFRSTRRLAELLDDATSVMPTHGFGSFCSSGDTSGNDASTIGRERRDNQALTTTDEDRFVEELLAGLDAYPSYYAQMAPINRSGPGPIDLSPAREIDAAGLRRAIHAGEWVVDLRTRTAFAEAHVHGTINVELADSASTYVGWLIAWGTPITLIADTPDDVHQMQRQLVRIGIDRPAGQRTPALHAADGGLEQRSYPVVDFAQLRAALDDDPDTFVLDARRNLEWRERHIAGAHHVPLHELEQRLGELPTDRSIWVHCATGYRASIAASLIERANREPVLVDGDFDERAPHLFDLVTGR